MLLEIVGWILKNNGNYYPEVGYWVLMVDTKTLNCIPWGTEKKIKFQTLLIVWSYSYKLLTLYSPLVTIISILLCLTPDDVNVESLVYKGLL